MLRVEGSFKKNNTFDKRKADAHRINNKYKDKVPIIVEVKEYNKNELILDKYKYLVPFDLNVSQFLFVIRKRINLNPDVSIFIFFNNSLQLSSETIGNVYKLHKDVDGFLYATISLENTFG